MTVDVVTPMVNDPETFGVIAATNALSDVYAMGGLPEVALSFVGFPTGAELDADPLEVLRAVLAGLAKQAVAASCAIVGGHTIVDPEPKAGLTGFTVSKLWGGLSDQPGGKPGHIASPLQIMTEGPLGGAAFNNEFGRPNLAGYFREYEQQVGGVQRGYHKPIMIAGGVGVIDAELTKKIEFPAGSLLIQLGGPGMRIGMGGSAASSMATGANAAELDFDSVQRGNPEIERRAQEVINHCWAMGEGGGPNGAGNPILAIHDVGAGGLSNAFPELTNDAGRGARFDLRAVPLEESGMAPKEIWCNESQERYVMAVRAEALPLFQAMAERERCPYAVVGVVRDERHVDGLPLAGEHFVTGLSPEATHHLALGFHQRFAVPGHFHAEDVGAVEQAVGMFLEPEDRRALDGVVGTDAFEERQAIVQRMRQHVSRGVAPGNQFAVVPDKTVAVGH